MTAIIYFGETPFALCAIRKYLSAPRITKVSSPSISLKTAVNKAWSMLPRAENIMRATIEACDALSPS